MVQELLRPNIDPLGKIKKRVDPSISSFKRKPTGIIPPNFSIQEEEKDILNNNLNSDHQPIDHNKFELVENQELKNDTTLPLKTNQKDKEVKKAFNSQTTKKTCKLIGHTFEKVTVANADSYFSRTSEFDLRSPSLAVLDGDFRFVTYHAKPESCLPPQPIGDLDFELGQEGPLADHQIVSQFKSSNSKRNTPELPSRKALIDHPQPSQAITFENSFNFFPNSSNISQKDRNESNSAGDLFQFGFLAESESSSPKKSVECFNRSQKDPVNLKSPNCWKEIDQKSPKKSPNLNLLKVLRESPKPTKFFFAHKHHTFAEQGNKPVKDTDPDNGIMVSQTLRNSNLENLLFSMENASNTNLEEFPTQKKAPKLGKFSPKPCTAKVCKGNFEIAQDEALARMPKKSDQEKGEEKQQKKKKTMTLSQLAEIKIQQLNEYKPQKY